MHITSRRVYNISPKKIQNLSLISAREGERVMSRIVYLDVSCYT